MTTTEALTGRDLGYCRISLDTEASGSINKQRERLAAHVVSKGRDPQAVVWFADESVSGSKVAFADRPEGGRLWSSLRKGDRVLVTKIDRAARSVKDLLSLVEHVNERGASITFIDNDIDTGSSSGKLVLTILGAIAEFEASLISERRKESLESFATEGRHAVGKAPVGFVSVPNPNGRGLVIAKDPETAPVVREAVMRVLDGEPQAKVRECLSLSTTGFARLLRNPRLAGMTPDGEGVVMINGVPRVNPEAAILSMAEWERLQSFLSTGEKAWSKASGFGRVLACGTCGERLYYQKGRKPEYDTYKCRRVKHAPGEPSGTVSLSLANPWIEKKFLHYFGRMPHIVVMFRDDDSARREAIAVAETTIAEVERRIREAGSREERRGLMNDLDNAFDALDAAKAMPSEGTEVATDTGETVADVWRRSDNEAREALILRRGRWFVKPGRASIDERLVWVPAGAEAEWSTDAEVSVMPEPVGVSLRDIGAGIVVNRA